MINKGEQGRINSLIVDTISMLCKNSIPYKSNLRVEGLICVTVDDNEQIFAHVSQYYEGPGMSIIQERLRETIEAKRAPRKRRHSSDSETAEKTSNRKRSSSIEDDSNNVISIKPEPLDPDVGSESSEHVPELYQSDGTNKDNLSHVNMDYASGIATLPNLVSLVGNTGDMNEEEGKQVIPIGIYPNEGGGGDGDHTHSQAISSAASIAGCSSWQASPSAPQPPNNQILGHREIHLKQEDLSEDEDWDCKSEATSEADEEMLPTAEDELKEADMVMPANQRHADTTDEMLDKMTKDRFSESTELQTRWAVKVLKSFLAEKNLDENFENLLTEELAAVLKRFYGCVRTQSGQFYAKSGLINMRYGIQRYLQESPNNRCINIVTDPAFAAANKVFGGQLALLKKMGKDGSASKETIDPKDLVLLYTSKTLSNENPTSLQYKVFVEIMIHFGALGRSSLWSYTKDTFEVKTNSEGKEFVTFKLPKSAEKERSHESYKPKAMFAVKNDPMCPVTSFKLYVSKLNPTMTSFWQRPKVKYYKASDCWFDNARLGKNNMSVFMKRISQNAGLSKLYTNKALGSTEATLLQEVYSVPDNQAQNMGFALPMRQVGLPSAASSYANDTGSSGAAHASWVPLKHPVPINPDNKDLGSTVASSKQEAFSVSGNQKQEVRFPLSTSQEGLPSVVSSYSNDNQAQKIRFPRKQVGLPSIVIDDANNNQAQNIRFELPRQTRQQAWLPSVVSNYKNNNQAQNIRFPLPRQQVGLPSVVSDYANNNQEQKIRFALPRRQVGLPSLLSSYANDTGSSGAAHDSWIPHRQPIPITPALLPYAFIGTPIIPATGQLSVPVVTTSTNAPVGRFSRSIVSVPPSAATGTVLSSMQPTPATAGLASLSKTSNPSPATHSSVPVVPAPLATPDLVSAPKSGSISSAVVVPKSVAPHTATTGSCPISVSSIPSTVTGTILTKTTGSTLYTKAVIIPYE